MITDEMTKAEARHNWPGGKYIDISKGCSVCGVTGYLRPKYAPRYCWPHWQEAEREAEWRRAGWEAAMTAEYGPYTPKPDPFARALQHRGEQS